MDRSPQASTNIGLGHGGSASPHCTIDVVETQAKAGAMLRCGMAGLSIGMPYPSLPSSRSAVEAREGLGTDRTVPSQGRIDEIAIVEPAQP